MVLRNGLLFCLVPFLATMAQDMSSQPLEAVAKSINDFSIDLYLAAAENAGPGKNILVSPLSASLVTAMLHAGAKGKTADEIANGLHLPKDKDTLEKGFKSLHETLNNTDGVTLEIANRIFLESSSRLKEDYQKTVSQVHNSEVQKSDFKNNPEKERVSINDWVSGKTHQKINNLLPAGMVKNETLLVLVNAVYFYGKWKEQFDRQQTYDEDFYVTKTKTVKVPMMHMTKTLRYADIPELDAKAVELSYANEKVSLQIILPNTRDGLEGLQQKLRNKTFDLSNIHFFSTKVHLSMPKFKIEETIDIKALYKKMGMSNMFSDGADLSGMVEGDDHMFVSDAIQKTFMDVNEEGTEAAAATGFKMVALSAFIPASEENVTVDHPYMIRLGLRPQRAARSPHNPNERLVLFLGSVHKPSSCVKTA